MYDILCFVYSSDDGHLGCFNLLAIVNNASVNIGVQISVLITVLNSFGYIPRSGFAGSYVNSVFKFLRNCHTIFHSSALSFRDLNNKKKSYIYLCSYHCLCSFFCVDLYFYLVLFFLCLKDITFFVMQVCCPLKKLDYFSFNIEL